MAPSVSPTLTLQLLVSFPSLQSKSHYCPEASGAADAPLCSVQLTLLATAVSPSSAAVPAANTTNPGVAQQPLPVLAVGSTSFIRWA